MAAGPAQGMSIEQATAALAQLKETFAAGLGTAENPYQAALMEFGPVLPGPPRTVDVEGGRDYRVSHSGKILYDNGVIFDPEQGVLAPPGKAVPGSREWLLKIQDEWSDKEANEWRKKLADQGYQVADQGGMGHDLLEALTEFHSRRYANGGRVQPLIPQAGREDPVEGAVDKVALRQEIKTWGQVPFGEDLEDAEADWFTDRIIQTASRLARKKGWDAGFAIESAKSRVMSDFAERPQVAALVEEQQDQEVSYKIRDSVVGLSQLLGA